MLLFESFALRQTRARNRLVMQPMCMESARDGLANDFHVLHYATRAMGGVGMVILEPVAVLPNGRITSRCLGLWDDGQVAPLKQVVDVCHKYGACVAVMLSHAGRKCQADTVSRVIAPSRVGFSTMAGYQEPDDMTPHEIGSVVEAFGMAAARAAAAGADAIEVQAGDGYLIHQFLSPLSNLRCDEYGGDTTRRARFLSEVLQAVRQNWPATQPLILRVSATDYANGGIEVPYIAEIVGRARERSGIDTLHVGAGGLLPVMVPHKPGFLVPYAEEVRNACGLPVIAEGMITTAEQAEEILQAKKADLIAMGRELLRNPYLPATAARRVGGPVLLPHPYERALPGEPAPC